MMRDMQNSVFVLFIANSLSGLSVGQQCLYERAKRPRDLTEDVQALLCSLQVHKPTRQVSR